ncbi:MAG: hypothetical protein AB8E82_01125 [Aureispira sp.]
MKTVLLDTSFLDSLVIDTRAFHENAKTYFSYFIKNGYTLILSTIVVSEYATQHSAKDLLKLCDFRILNFELIHAAKAEHINLIKYRRNKTGNRNCFKDDLKIIAQATCIPNLDYLITGDNGFYNFLEKQKAELGFDSYFQPVHFHKELPHYFDIQN